MCIRSATVSGRTREDSSCGSAIFPGGNRQVSPGVATTPVSTAYWGIMSVTSVRLPDSFHIVRPRSPSPPSTFQLKLAYGNRACQNANVPSMRSSAPSVRRDARASRRARDGSGVGFSRTRKKKEGALQKSFFFSSENEVTGCRLSNF